MERQMGLEIEVGGVINRVFHVTLETRREPAYDSNQPWDLYRKPTVLYQGILLSVMTRHKLRHLQRPKRFWAYHDDDEDWAHFLGDQFCSIDWSSIGQRYRCCCELSRAMTLPRFQAEMQLGSAEFAAGYWHYHFHSSSRSIAA